MEVSLENLYVDIGAKSIGCCSNACPVASLASGRKNSYAWNP